MSPDNLHLPSIVNKSVESRPDPLISPSPLETNVVVAVAWLLPVAR